jgi:hypothetical protein
MASRKKKQKLEKVVNGKPVRYSVDVPHMQICCDCGLTHTVIYRIINRQVEETVYRNDYVTAKRRRK